MAHMVLSVTNQASLIVALMIVVLRTTIGAGVVVFLSDGGHIAFIVEVPICPQSRGLIAVD